MNIKETAKTVQKLKNSTLEIMHPLLYNLAIKRLYKRGCI